MSIEEHAQAVGDRLHALAMDKAKFIINVAMASEQLESSSLTEEEQDCLDVGMEAGITAAFVLLCPHLDPAYLKELLAQP